MSRTAEAVAEQQAPVFTGEESGPALAESPASNEIAYITLIARAQDGSKTLVASADATNDQVSVQLLNHDDDLQLWERRSTRNGKGYALINKKRGKCLARPNGIMGAGLVLAGLDQIETSDLAVWRDDTVQGTYNAINSYADWEQKIHIAGSGPYKAGNPLISWEWSKAAVNELWLQKSQIKSISIEKVDFDLSAGKIEDQEPKVAGSQFVENDTDVEQSQKLTFRFVESHTYRFSHEHGLKVGIALEFEGGLPFVGETKVKISTEGHWKFSEETASTEQKEVTVELPVRIEAHSRILAETLLLYARLNVPYVATLKVTYWNDEVLTKTTYGEFSGVNCYNVVTKLTKVNPATRIEERPIA